MSVPTILPSKYQIDQEVTLTSVSVAANPCTVIAVCFRRSPLGVKVQYDLRLGGAGGLRTRTDILETAIAEWPKT